MQNTLTIQRSAINTPDQRLRVFISSTIEELASERLAAKKAINNLHLTPVMFELGARPHAPRDVYSSYLSQSHIFIGIYGERYGWIVPELDISGLEDEFHLSANHPRLIYIKKEAPGREARLKEMVDVILNSGVSCKFFSDTDELCELIENDLALLLTERFENGGTSARTKPTPTAIPLPPTPIIGREAEVADVIKLLHEKEVGLLTLTGTGGIGKTRMALEVARKMQKDFRDGVYFVSLASVSEAEVVPSTLVQAIFPGESGGQPPLELLIKLFSGKQALIVLDNFEQVIGAAPFVADLLRGCEGVKALVTSREILRLSGEHQFPVPVLSLPDTSDNSQNLAELKKQIESSSSVRLFLQCAKAINPAFELTKENAAAVAEICIRLDGLPLAIELAAARVRILTPQAMLPHLGKSLSLLTTGKRDMPERHRTLLATIDWSYHMLLPEEQQLLSRLSVFSGGWTLQSAFAVAGGRNIMLGECPRLALYLANPADTAEPLAEATLDFLEQMESLAAKNLIRSAEQAGEIRFMMYVTIKEYTQQRLMRTGEKEPTEKNHFNYFLRLAENLWDSLRGRDAVHSFEILDREIDNMREALRWGLENDPVQGLRLALALGEYWDKRGMSHELIWWTNVFIQKIEAGKFEAVSALTALAKIEMGRAEFRENNHGKCKELTDEVSRISRLLHNDYLFVDSQIVRGLVDIYNGDYEQIKRMEEGLAVSRKLNYKLATITLLQNLASAANFEGRLAESITLAGESLALAENIGASHWEGTAHINLGFAQIKMGEIDASAASYSKAIQCCKRFMDTALVVYPLVGMSQVALARGNTGVAIQLLAAVEKFCERKGTAIVPVVRQIISFMQEAVKSQVGNEEYQRVHETGSRLQMNEAIEIAGG